MKNKMLIALFASVVLNVILLFSMIEMIDNAENAKSIEKNNELKIYREIIENHFAVLNQLDVAVNSENIDEVADAILIGQNIIFRSIRLQDSVEVPQILKAFHNSLHVYLFQYQKTIRNKEHSENVKKLKALADMFTEYKKVFEYSYYDDKDVMKEKLTKATNEVIKPFWESGENPL